MVDESMSVLQVHDEGSYLQRAGIGGPPFRLRLIAQYLQILAIDGFLSLGSLISVWAYMWLMLESTSAGRLQRVSDLCRCPV